MKRIHRIVASIVIAIVASFSVAARAPAQTKDPLPSWADRPVKKAIVDFVNAVTTPGGKDFVPIADRIAVFDNDGTLWCEKPTIQAVFALDRLKQMAAKDPKWKTKQPFKAALEMDKKYLHEAGEKALMQILTATHTGMTQTEFKGLAKKFFATAKHPKYKVLYKKLTFQPMVELLEYLRANGFKTYICSGGGIYFMRLVTEEIYGIPPQNVIGSSPVLKFETRDGKVVLVRLAKVGSICDKIDKPTNIALHIGKIPLLAAGNVRSGGDVAMLRYCQSNKRRTLQLLINHDDAKREYAYGEKNRVSLNSAEQFGWNVVSMQNDWKQIFANK